MRRCALGILNRAMCVCGIVNVQSGAWHATLFHQCGRRALIGRIGGAVGESMMDALAPGERFRSGRRRLRFNSGRR